MNDRTRHILERLDQVREDLLALSDDIWQSIDHNDTQALEEGVAFKHEYNARMAAFDQLAGEISTLVRQFTAVRLDESDQADQRSPQAAERIIRDLDQRQAHELNEDFTFKRPYGFQLGDEARSGVTTWRRLFELICLYLQGLDPRRFASLPGHPKFISRRGNPVFSEDPRLALRHAAAQRAVRRGQPVRQSPLYPGWEPARCLRQRPRGLASLPAAGSGCRLNRRPRYDGI